MVEFTLHEPKKIVVHQIAKYPLEHFVTSHSIGIPENRIARAVTWVDGIMFDKQDMPENDEVIKDKLSGIEHWNYLHYTVFEPYRSEFKMVGNIRIPIINVSENQTYKDMAKWIKENFEKPKKET
ncbi:MAG: hypothetical protein WC325_04650 [Candidatus Bathyarchaeia archaeon]